MTDPTDIVCARCTVPLHRGHGGFFWYDTTNRGNCPDGSYHEPAHLDGTRFRDLNRDGWPAYGSNEHGTLHTLMWNEIGRALDHCYSGADASGYGWTTEGWLNVSIGNILGALADLGFRAPEDWAKLDGLTTNRPPRVALNAIHAHWRCPDDEPAPVDARGKRRGRRRTDLTRTPR